MLIVGLAVIGAQVQDADHTVHTMERRIRAIHLAEQLLAELEMGLIELESVDEIEEEDFGPRHPDFGWLLTTERTSVEDVYLLKLEILHHLREDEYREDEFEHDIAESILTVYAMRSAPKPVNFAEDFGLNEEEVTELSEQLDTLGIEGLTIDTFDPQVLQNVDFEELVAALPVVMDALGMNAAQLTAMIPPNLISQLRDNGILGEEGLGELEGLIPGGEAP